MRSPARLLSEPTAREEWPHEGWRIRRSSAELAAGFDGRLRTPTGHSAVSRSNQLLRRAYSSRLIVQWHPPRSIPPRSIRLAQHPAAEHPAAYTAAQHPAARFQAGILASLLGLAALAWLLTRTHEQDDWNQVDDNIATYCCQCFVLLSAKFVKFLSKQYVYQIIAIKLCVSPILHLMLYTLNRTTNH